jgi:hypothetical protein
MGFISNMIDQQRVWKTLPDYPVYSPPFHDSEAVLSKKEIKANYDYFLEQKARRLEYLANYLRPFSVELSISREGLSALDHWLFRCGGHLIPSGGEVIAAMHDYEPAWVGEYHGLNIVHDMAISAGDYIIAKNKNVRWDVFYGSRGKRDYEKIGFGQACLIGLCHYGCSSRDYYSIFHGVFEVCSAGRRRLRDGNRGSKLKFDIAGEFVSRLDYLGNPNPPPIIPFSQLTMDD